MTDPVSALLVGWTLHLASAGLPLLPPAWLMMVAASEEDWLLAAAGILSLFAVFVGIFAAYVCIIPRVVLWC